MKSEYGGANRRIFSNTSYILNSIHLRNPWVSVWWSAAFPGFGHILLNSYIMGFALIIFEYLMNTLSNLNLGIYYSMIGEIDKAKEVINKRFFFGYMGVYIFAMFDCYRRTVELNKKFIIEYRKNESLDNTFFISPLEVNGVEKKNPILSIIWSLLAPGSAHIYLQQIPKILLGLFWWTGVAYMSRFYEGIYYTMIGNFALAALKVSPKWFLYIPSIYTFTAYSAYVDSVENNKLFEFTQARILKEKYQNHKFKMPY